MSMPAALSRLPALPSRRQTGLVSGWARVALGGVFLADPMLSIRILGLDAGTAARVTWLARMAAARDIGIGAGTANAARHDRDLTPWLLAGAFSDLVDGVVIAAAGRRHRLDPMRAALGSALALGAAAAVVAVTATPERPAQRSA